MYKNAQLFPQMFPINTDVGSKRCVSEIFMYVQQPLLMRPMVFNVSLYQPLAGKLKHLPPFHTHNTSVFLPSFTLHSLTLYLIHPVLSPPSHKFLLPLTSCRWAPFFPFRVICPWWTGALSWPHASGCWKWHPCWVGFSFMKGWTRGCCFRWFSL